MHTVCFWPTRDSSKRMTWVPCLLFSRVFWMTPDPWHWRSFFFNSFLAYLSRSSCVLTQLCQIYALTFCAMCFSIASNRLSTSHRCLFFSSCPVTCDNSGSLSCSVCFYVVWFEQSRRFYGFIQNIFEPWIISGLFELAQCCFGFALIGLRRWFAIIVGCFGCAILLTWFNICCLELVSVGSFETMNRLVFLSICCPFLRCLSSRVVRIFPTVFPANSAVVIGMSRFVFSASAQIQPMLFGTCPALMTQSPWMLLFSLHWLLAF